MPVTKAEMEARPVGQIAETMPDVVVRVTRKGHGKISTGRHDAVTGDELYATGESFQIAENIALDLEDRGLVAIQDRPTEDVFIPEKRGPGRPPKVA